MGGLSVIIITRDEENNLPGCLESVSWAEEIVVVDSGSTDQTQAVARKYASRVVEQEWLGFGRQKAYALSLASQTWVLSLDADERVSEGLQSEIRQVLGNDPDVNGYEVRRQNYFLGRLIHHGGWQRDWVLRLFRRGKGSFTPVPVHERVELEGKRDRLKHPLLHFPYRSLDDYFRTLNLYANLSADWLAEQGRRTRWDHLLLRPPGKFFRMYVLERGFLDGYPGLVLAGLSAFHLFTRYARLWEKMKNSGDQSQDDK